MAAVKAKTVARGYTSQHKRERERRLARYRPGDVCAHGGERMWWWPLAVARQYLDLPHTLDRTGYLPGLSCRRCNRGEPNRRRGKTARGVVATWQQSRLW
jgi:hypothetical protein